MTTLFRREWAVTLGSLRSTGLRVQFRVTKTAATQPNTLDLSVTNLSPDSRAATQQRGLVVLVEAGYEGASELLFAGDARTVTHSRQGADWVTRIQCGDGERAFATARVSESFGPGSKVVDVLSSIATKLGLRGADALEQAKKAAAGESFPNGVALSGRASDELTRVAARAGLEWSIQDGRLQLVPRGKATVATAVLLSADAGLVGAPEIGDKGVVRVRSLLLPGLRPGRAVRLKSEALHGDFRAERVVHVGDSHGAAWYSEAELKRL